MGLWVEGLEVWGCGCWGCGNKVLGLEMGSLVFLGIKDVKDRSVEAGGMMIGG